jgi:hypothetical protein
MKGLFLFLGLGFFAKNSLAVPTLCSLALRPHTPSAQEIAFFKYNDLALDLSRTRSDLAFSLLADLNGWNRFGPFSHSAVAALLVGQSIIDHGTFSQLASNGNIEQLPLDFSDALVLAYLVAQADGPVKDVFSHLLGINARRLPSADEVLMAFSMEVLKISPAEAPQAIAHARNFIGALLKGEASEEALREHYLGLILKKKNLSVDELNKLRDKVGSDPANAQILYLALVKDLGLEKSLELVREHHSGALETDSLLYILREYSPRNSALILSAVDLAEKRFSHFYLKISLKEALEISRELKRVGEPWAPVRNLMVSTISAAGLKTSLPMPLSEVLKLSRALTEEKLSAEDALVFFRTQSYWPSEGNVLDFKRWFRFSQLLHWYRESLFSSSARITEEEDDDEYGSSPLHATILKPLTGKLITADLILDFAKNAPARRAYFATFRASVSQPKRGFLGWPWGKKYFGEAPYPDYNTYIEETHKQALKAAGF